MSRHVQSCYNVSVQSKTPIDTPLSLLYPHIIAIKNAFNTLGYKCYHANETSESGVPKALKYWKEGIEAKYLGKCKPYGKAEFDKLLKNYSVRHSKLL
jgi:hypothetical protein